MGGSGMQCTGMSEGDKKNDHAARVWRLVNGIVPWGLFVLALTGASLLLVLTGWVLFDFFNVLDNPPLNEAGQNDRAAVRNVGLVLAALVAGGFAIWRAEIAKRAAEAAQDQVKIARSQFERSLDRDYADLFTKAVEQLGTTRESRLANLLKSELKRNGVTYAQLVERLAELGISKKEANIANKLARGKFSAVFLMQCLEAIGVRELRL